MAFEPLRFVHAGDFHLERSLHGLVEVPDHLREVIREAPYRAAERVFDAVLAENADFLLLAGDLFHPRKAGARAFAFLGQQFERLAARDVPVYWACGRVDRPDLWPQERCWPANVRTFAAGPVEEVVHRRQGRPPVRLLGSSYDGHRVRLLGVRPAADGMHTVAVVHGRPDPRALAEQPINYWAFGGEHQRRIIPSSTYVAACAGTPQGRQPQESGPHGCLLVQIDDAGRGRPAFVPTDSVRWQHEKIEAETSTKPGDLERSLTERVHELVEGSPAAALLIHWKVTAAGPLATALRRGDLSADLVGRLRSRFGHGTPAAWTVGLEAETMEVLPAHWFEQETVLGGFLRAVRRCQSDEHPPCDLGPFLNAQQPAALAEMVALADPAVRQRVLQQAAQLGLDLLTGEDLAS